MLANSSARPIRPNGTPRPACAIKRAAIRAAQRVLAALKEDGDTRRIERELATFQERENAVGTARWRALEEKYMGVAG